MGSYRKPVEQVLQWGGMEELGKVENESCSCILDQLLQVKWHWKGRLARSQLQESSLKVKRDWTNTWVAYVERNIQILLKKRQWHEQKGRWLFMVIPKLCAVTKEEIRVLSREIAGSWCGKELAGMNTGSVSLGLSFIWWAVIHNMFSVRHAEIQAEAWVSEGGKDKLSIICLEVVEKLCEVMTSLRDLV